jgi:hypothetical protein
MTSANAAVRDGCSGATNYGTLLHKAKMIANAKMHDMVDAAAFAAAAASHVNPRGNNNINGSSVDSSVVRLCTAGNKGKFPNQAEELEAEWEDSAAEYNSR